MGLLCQLVLCWTPSHSSSLLPSHSQLGRDRGAHCSHGKAFFHPCWAWMEPELPFHAQHGFLERHFGETHRVDSRELLGYLHHQRHDDSLPVLGGGEKLSYGDFLLTSSLLLFLFHLFNLFHWITVSSKPFQILGKQKIDILFSVVDKV